MTGRPSHELTNNTTQSRRHTDTAMTNFRGALGALEILLGQALTIGVEYPPFGSRNHSADIPAALAEIKS